MAQGNDTSLHQLRAKAVEAYRPKGESNDLTGLTILTGVVWTALTYATHGWPWYGGALLGVLSGLGLLVVCAIFESLLESFRMSKRQAEPYAFVLALLLAGGLWWAAYEPDWVAAAMVAFGLGSLPIVRRNAHQGRRAELAVWGLSEATERSAAALPEDLPQDLERLLDAALRDHRDLREVVEGGLVPPDVAPKDLLADADSTLRALFRQAPLIAKLVEFSSRDRRDQSARRRAEEALARMAQQAETLHDAVAAVLDYAAVQETDVAPELRDRIERLRLAAASQDELEAELQRLTAEA